MTDLLTRLEAKTKYAGLLAFAKDNSRGFGKRALLANELIALYSENERLRLALVEAVKTVPCDQDMHARHRVNECDRCALETKIIAILEGKP